MILFDAASLNVVASVVPEIRHVQNREFAMPLIMLIVCWRLKSRFFLNCFSWFLVVFMYLGHVFVGEVVPDCRWL